MTNNEGAGGENSVKEGKDEPVEEIKWVIVIDIILFS